MAMGEVDFSSLSEAAWIGLPFTTIAYLSRCFKKNGSGNISDYLTDYRVSKAKELLSRTGQDEVPVSEVSNLCGFGSLRTFMRVFKACEGVTPGQYRQSLGKEE